MPQDFDDKEMDFDSVEEIFKQDNLFDAMTPQRKEYRYSLLLGGFLMGTDGKETLSYKSLLKSLQRTYPNIQPKTL